MMAMRSSATRASLLALVAVTAVAASPALGQDCESFRRGDGNADGTVNIADPVVTLNFLFAGGAIACQDAADANDTGELDITDPIFTLNFLFLGGVAPAPPGPAACGRDPTLDRLACLESSCRDEEPILIDESGFTRFHYSIHPGLGFCPGVDPVFEATIERTGNGSYRFEHSVLEEGAPGDPGCLPDVITGDCLVAVTRPARDLVPAEVERVLSEFEEVRIHLENAALCDCIAFDPCLIRRFSWDGALVSDFLCDAPFLDGDEAAAIADLLDSLAGPAGP